MLKGLLSGSLAYPDTDFHRVNVAPSRAHLEWLYATTRGHFQPVKEANSRGGQASAPGDAKRIRDRKRFASAQAGPGGAAAVGPDPAIGASGQHQIAAQY